MTIQEANKFKRGIDRKLRDRGVLRLQREKAEKTLARCVMGGMMVEAFRVLYT